MEQHIGFICGFVFAICLIAGIVCLWFLLRNGFIDKTRKAPYVCNVDEKNTLDKELILFKGPFELSIYSEYRGGGKFKHFITVKAFGFTIFHTFHHTAINDEGSFYIRGFEQSRDISKPFEQSFLN